MTRLSPVTAAIILLLIVVAPQAAAAWSITSSAPASLRPNREATFTYHAQSNSALDPPIELNITLITCEDADLNGWCEADEPRYATHGSQEISLLGGQGGSRSWSLSLSEPEATMRYQFASNCIEASCTSQQQDNAYNATGGFALKYDDTWTRTIIVQTPVRAGEAKSVHYELESHSPDDKDLHGFVHLRSTTAERVDQDHGEREFSIAADGRVLLTWQNVDFPLPGNQTLTATDTIGTSATLDVPVRDVHLHVHQPRETYTAGNTFSLYLSLEGHGETPSPQPLGNQTISVSVLNGTFVVEQRQVTTTEDGRAYVSFQTAEDHAALAWTATTNITWLDATYEARANGTILLRGPPTSEDVESIRADLDDMRLEGVHLDDIGSRHVFLTSVRAASGVGVAMILILLVIYIAIRV